MSNLTFRNRKWRMKFKTKSCSGRYIELISRAATFETRSWQFMNYFKFFQKNYVSQFLSLFGIYQLRWLEEWLEWHLLKQKTKEISRHEKVTPLLNHCPVCISFISTINFFRALLYQFSWTSAKTSSRRYYQKMISSFCWIQRYRDYFYFYQFHVWRLTCLLEIVKKILFMLLRARRVCTGNSTTFPRIK